MRKIVQWVNLPKKKKFVKKGITLARCGRLQVTLTFATDEFPVMYKVRVIPIGNNNVVYTDKEMKRNHNFKLCKGMVGVAQKKTITIEDIQLPAAGGNRYKIEVKDENGNIVGTTIDLETHRKLYYQVIVMGGTTGRVPSYPLTTMEQDSLQHFITLTQKGEEVSMPYIKTLTEDNDNIFVDEVNKAFTFDGHFKKVGFATVFSEYIADLTDAKFVHTVNIGTPNSSCFWDGRDVIFVGAECLWYGLDDEDDHAKKWFIKGSVTFTDENGSNLNYTIVRADVDITGSKEYTYGGYRNIKININPELKALLNNKSGLLVFEMMVNVVAGWTGGFGLKHKGIKLITCARRSRWEDLPSTTLEFIWNHEVGHHFGMVAYGNKNYPDNKYFYPQPKQPDAPSTLYGENPGQNDYTHWGPHCSQGVTYDHNTHRWYGTPTCVMFGAQSNVGHHAPKDYCGECAPIVRKLDLSG